MSYNSEKTYTDVIEMTLASDGVWEAKDAPKAEPIRVDFRQKEKVPVPVRRRETKRTGFKVIVPDQRPDEPLDPRDWNDREFEQ